MASDVSAEQRTSLENIKAGGNVTVSPTQILYVQAAAPEREWAEALLRGPVDAARQADELERAQRFAEAGSHGDAATSLGKVAAALREHGYESVADAYQEQQALQLEADDKPEAAFAAAVGVTRSRLARDDPRADASTQLAARLASPASQWIAAGLLVCVDGPEANFEELPALDEAVAKAAGREDEQWWAARAAELYLLDENFIKVLEIASGARQRTALTSGARLDLELDFVEALERVNGVDEAEAVWSDLLRWSDDPSSCPPADTARTLQRRAVALTRRGELEEVRRTSLKAIAAWSRVPGHQDQAGEAFFSYRVARQLLGAPLVDDSEVAQVAAELRGAAASAAVRADALELDGLHKRQDGNHAEARRKLLLALREHHRAGNLHGELAASVALAALHESSNLHDAALELRIRWGQMKDVVRLAPRVPAEIVASMARVQGPAWIRAASYTALTPHLGALPPSLTEAFAGPILDEAEQVAGTPWGSDPVYRARTAACGLVLIEENTLRARALSVARQLLGEGSFEHRKVAADGLWRATEAGLDDAAEELIEDYLNELGSHQLPSPVIGEAAAARPELVERLRASAIEGSFRALEALAAADLIGGDADLRTKCDALVAAQLEISDHSEEVANGVSTRSVSMVIWEGTGLVGRACSEQIRAELTDKLVSIVGDPVDLEPNRASAANALLNLAPAIPENEISRTIDELEPLALGRYAPSGWDREHLESLHPYSRFRLDVVLPDALRAAAVRTIGRTADPASGYAERLSAVVEPALFAGSSAVMAAALDLLARRHELPIPVPLSVLFQHDDVEVRFGALKAYVARHGLPKGELLKALLADPSPRIRYALRGGAERDPHGRDILKRLLNDRDAFVRALALHSLERSD